MIIKRKLFSNKKESSATDDLKRGASIVGGAIAAKKGLDVVDDVHRSGEISGRVRLYHGTTAKNEKKILEEGLKGKKAAEKEAAGEKESKLSRHSGWASGLAVQSPGLVSEAMASKHGLDLMKKAGASKKLMKASRKNLGAALGTYAGIAVTNAGMSELARGIAYRKKKKKLEKEEKNKKKDDK